MLKSLKREWEDQITGNFSGRDMDRHFQDGYSYPGGPPGGYDPRHPYNDMVHAPRDKSRKKSNKYGGPEDDRYTPTGYGVPAGVYGPQGHPGYERYDQRYGPQGFPMQPYPAPINPVSMNASNTTIINQPQADKGAPIYMPQNIRRWSTGLFGCFEDLGICIYTLFCGWCQACSIAGQLNENICVVCCVQGGAMTLRTKYRVMHGIRGDICGDCLATTCCGFCALTQLARELKNRPY